MTDKSLHYLPATELVKRIQDKSLSPVELMKATIARAEELNPGLNAICTTTFDAAIDQAMDELGEAVTR